MRKIILINILLLTIVSCNRDIDAEYVDKIYKAALADSTSYFNLKVLSKQYGSRLGGSEQSLKAVAYLKKVMEDSGFDTVYLQECMVANWMRGKKELGKIFSEKNGESSIAICALGNSIATPSEGITANVIEVTSFEDLERIGNIKGKIVFYNQPMNPNSANPFQAYGEVVKFRFSGAAVAAGYGAIAVIIRSVTSSIDTFPHTGVMRYEAGVNQIPAVTISTIHANQLSDWLKQDSNLKVYIKTECKSLSDVVSYNVIGEIKGHEFSDQTITVGGHLDTWDITEGAHDDGAGCVQSIEVLRLFKKIGYQPKRTIRAVMFMDEEMNQRGARKYAEIATAKSEEHTFALEADVGAGKPLGFNIGKDSLELGRFLSYKKYFEPYGVTLFNVGGGGADINFLSDLNPVLCLFITDPTNYFNYHHSAYDTFEKIDFNNLQEGSATLASLIYFVDKYGVGNN